MLDHGKLQNLICAGRTLKLTATLLCYGAYLNLNLLLDKYADLNIASLAHIDFKDADDYLDVQFRLLREDFVSTIRNGIRDYKKNQTLTGPQKFKSGDVKIYDNLYIAGSSFGRDGLTYIVR